MTDGAERRLVALAVAPIALGALLLVASIVGAAFGGGIDAAVLVGAVVGGLIQASPSVVALLFRARLAAHPGRMRSVQMVLGVVSALVIFALGVLAVALLTGNDDGQTPFVLIWPMLAAIIATPLIFLTAITAPRR